MQAFKPTNHRVKKGVQRLSGTKTNEAFGYEQEGDLKSAVREAKLKKVDLDKIGERGWYVQFNNGVSARVKTSSDLGLEYLPDGKTENGFLYPEEEVLVKVIYDSSGKISHIVSTQVQDKDTNTQVGSTRIARGLSEISINQESSSLSTQNSRIETDPESIKLLASSIWLNGTQFDGVSNSITVAAYNSLDEFKRRATFLCAGDDDNEIVQKAIDYVGEGGLINFAPGTYRLSGIELKGNCMLEGSGSNTMFYLKDNATENLMNCKAKNIKIQNIKFNGNHLNQSNYKDIISVGESSYFDIRNCEFENIRGSAIVFDGSEANGMCHDNNVINCKINGCMKDAIKVNRAYDITIQLCNINNSGISNLNTSGAISISLSNYVSLDLCKIKESEANGIYIYSSKGVKIGGLNIEKSNLNGILMNQVKNSILQNNSIDGSGRANTPEHKNGILIYDGVDNSITSSNITDYEGVKTQNYGIYMKHIEKENEPDYTLIKDNLLRGNKISAMVLEGDNNIVVDNMGG